MTNQEIPIWRIKYYPNTLDDVCGRTQTILRLNKIIESQNYPHLIFAGPKGIGKTTIAKLFAKTFLGKYYDANFKIIYANVPLTERERELARSDAYISTLKIGSLAGKKITTPAFLRVRVKPFIELKALGGAPFKILIVKNFESLGSNQQGFRRLMEIYGSNCRMILITTKISGIIDPILSRCQVFIIPQVDFNAFQELILKIAEKEGFTIKNEVISYLYKLSEGKIARAIDFLQLCSIKTQDVSVELIYEVASKFRSTNFEAILEHCLKKEFTKARESYRKIISEMKFSTSEFLLEFLNEINKSSLSTPLKIELTNYIAETDFRSLDSRDSDIQVSALLSKICLLTENIKKA